MNNENLSFEEQLKKYDEEFEQLEADKDYCMETYEHIKKLADECLRDKVYDRLFEEVLPYFENPEEYPRFRPTAEMYRIWRLLTIIRMELTCSGRVIYVSHIDSYAEYAEQYILTTFAMRRLELGISEQGMKEAKAYLDGIPLSVYAAVVITENEKFEQCPRLYWSIYKCMKDRWTAEEKILWLKLLSEKEQSPDVLLELASLTSSLKGAPGHE
jgi:hypothetical protein